MVSEIKTLVMRDISKLDGSSTDSSYFFFSLNEKYFKCKFLMNYLIRKILLKDIP